MQGSRMRLYRTEAVILTDSDLGDQDKVITLFSKNYGKVKAVAKGARRLKSRFSPAIQMLSYVTAVLYESKRTAMDTLNECEINSSFLGIRKDLLRLAYGYYVAELMMKFVQGSETPRFLFDLLLKTLFSLEKISKQSLPALIHSFELKILSILGYRPFLEGCIDCGRPIKKCNTLYFSGYEGGILCPSCSKDKAKKAISHKVVQWMSFLLTASLGKVVQVKLTQDLRRELELIPQDYIPHRVGEALLSYSFIEIVEALEPGSN